MTAAITSAHPNKVQTIALCFLVAVIEGYDLQVLSAAGPLLRGPLHLDHQQLGVIFSASLIGLGIGAALGGYVADRVGRKRVIVLASLAMSLFTFASALASGYPTLFLGRFLTGLAIGGAMPNTIVVVEAMADRRRAAGLVTLMMCGIPVGGIVAALASQGLAAHLGWRGLFVFGGAFSLLVAIGAQLAIADLRPTPTKMRSTHRGADVLFGEGRAPVTLLLWALSMLSLAIVALLAGWLPTLVVDKGLPPSAGFSTLLAWNIGGVFGVILVGRLCDSLGPRNTLLLAYLTMGALFVVFAKASTASTLMAFAAVVNFFVAGSHYTVFGLSPRLYPADGAGTGVGATLAVGRVGAVLGPIVAGAFLHAGSTGSQVILGLVPIALVCALCVLFLVFASRGKLDRLGVGTPALPVADG
jgi:MFS transporter, AAHS family, 3-hydroxyphenylpropionic acid transporter